MEHKLFVAMRRFWRRQAQRIRERLEWRAGFGARKAAQDVITEWIGDFDDDWWAEGMEATEAELARILSAAARDGVALFADQASIGMDYALSNRQASTRASKYTTEWLRGLNKTTRQALRDGLVSFVETPGFTIGDVMDLLPFDDRRAERVAVTEITRVYALGNQVAGEQLASEFPGVRVVKTWITNNDDRVCDICGPLDGVEVGIDEAFQGGDGEYYENPPAHVFCRCFTETRTRIES